MVVSKIFYFHPEPWRDDPIWRAYFSNGLVQPPTSWPDVVCWKFSHGLVKGLSLTLIPSKPALSQPSGFGFLQRCLEGFFLEGLLVEGFWEVFLVLGVFGRVSVSVFWSKHVEKWTVAHCSGNHVSVDRFPPWFLIKSERYALVLASILIC